MNAVKSVISPNAPAEIHVLVTSLAESGIPADARFIYRGRNIIAATPLLDGAEANIKAFRAPHIINRAVYGWFRGSKACRAFHNGLRLRRLGVRTPEPYAYIEETSRTRMLRRSYFVSEQLHPDYEEIRFVHRRPDFGPLVEALAGFVADFHRKGVWMKDLSPGNVMVRRLPDGAYHFALIDINRMEFDTSDIRLLTASCGTLLDSEEALSLFAGLYAGRLGIDGAEAEEIILKRFERVNRSAIRRRRIKSLLFLK